MKNDVKPKVVSVTKPTQKTMNVQDRFLKEVVNKIVTIRTVDGNECTGCLKFFDKFCIRLEYTDKFRSLIYKSAISRIDAED